MRLNKLTHHALLNQFARIRVHVQNATLRQDQASQALHLILHLQSVTDRDKCLVQFLCQVTHLAIET